MWSPGLVSAKDAAGAVSVPEPRAHFGSSLLVLQYGFGGLMWSLPILQGDPQMPLTSKPPSQLWTTWDGIDIAITSPCANVL